MLPGHDGSSNVVYKEDGTIYCYDKVSEPPVRHPMAYIGYEPERETLKYRCPAKHEGWDCPMSESATRASRTARRCGWIAILPAAPPVPAPRHQEVRADVQGGYAVERVNGRLKVFWGVDDGNLTGARRFVAQVGVVLAVHAAFATLLA